MSEDELDRARAREAIIQRNADGNPHISTGAVEVAVIAARLAREGWTPSPK